MANETISNLKESTIDKYRNIANELSGTASGLPVQSGEIIGWIHQLSVAESLQIHSQGFDERFRKIYTRKDDLNAWYYDRAAKFPGQVIEITSDDFDNALGCVPTIVEKLLSGKKIFGVGEMYSGEITFWFCASQRNGETKYHGVLSNLQRAKELLPII